MSEHPELLGLPPNCRDANRLLLAVEQCVRNFPRYPKYQVGADLRHQAMQVARLAQRAWRDKAQQADHVARLVWMVDELKLALQRLHGLHSEFSQAAAGSARCGPRPFSVFSGG